MSTGAPEQSPPRRILCVGMCVLDIIHVCEQFPEEDSDKRCLSGYWQRGGNASNISTVLRNLNADCEFLGMLSKSPAFGFLLEDQRKRGIKISNCPTTTQDPPFSSVILVKEKDSRTIVHSNSNFPILTYEHFNKLNLADYTWIHFEARNPTETLLMLKDIYAFNASIKDTLKRSKIKISVELEKERLENLVIAELADYVILGKDFAKYLGWHDAKTALFGLREKLQPQAVAGNRRPALICTWGAAGASCLTVNDEYYNMEAVKPSVIVDPLGAGDVFCAATIYNLHYWDKDLKDAVDFGSKCAGYKIEHRGYDDIKDFKLPEYQPLK